MASSHRLFLIHAVTNKLSNSPLQSLIWLCADCPPLFSFQCRLSTYSDFVLDVDCTGQSTCWKHRFCLQWACLAVLLQLKAVCWLSDCYSPQSSPCLWFPPETQCSCFSLQHRLVVQLVMPHQSVLHRGDRAHCVGRTFTYKSSLKSLVL